jgi:hypothetical protein
MRNGVLTFVAVGILALAAVSPSYAGEDPEVLVAASLGDLQSRMVGSDAVQTRGMNASAQWYNSNGDLKCSECFYLDAYDPPHTGSAPTGSPWILGPVFTSGNLTSGKLYLVPIRGAVSYWAQTGPATSWASPPATWTGTLGNPPPYPSPGTANGYTGFDWENVFAIPYAFSDFPIPAHLPAEGISVDGGVTFTDYIPVGGQVYHSNHVSQYLLVGQGKKAGFRITDTGPTSDNSGRYKICLQLLSACGSSDGTCRGDD